MCQVAVAHYYLLRTTGIKLASDFDLSVSYWLVSAQTGRAGRFIEIAWPLAWAFDGTWVLVSPCCLVLSPAAARC